LTYVRIYDILRKSKKPLIKRSNFCIGSKESRRWCESGIPNSCEWA